MLPHTGKSALCNQLSQSKCLSSFFGQLYSATQALQRYARDHGDGIIADVEQELRPRNGILGYRDIRSLVLDGR